MLRIKRKQPSQWSRCRHASLCSSKQSGSIHKIIQVRCSPDCKLIASQERNKYVTEASKRSQHRCGLKDEVYKR
ncbi:hypothetical protein AUA35_07765 [Salmonella enterica subsp. enterica serovar Worthington]|uniref:Uncharacterized protein n=4 Tax=Salmonella enterica TaxID=28901 RepID=A0A5T2Y7C0_SALER|nr:hypothetical protein A9G52_04875 [Salmonella enterica subsp. enterica serovar Worthington]EAA0438979.1 hypothetical protein [Salmonella enterica]EBP3890125.1 hypothetical protein [Salmonella enterica subsp. enterica]EBU8747868.1 hypothetical protein [Salmonella enterica subsp. enterica serovar Ordonez]EBV8193196.1 hypothetical protein [Salmonella enterica subsp. enterica serovar Derby]ECS2865684.1 hypothetical protein [Salmonella enterica subsp. enterica serovar Farmsen]ECZ8888882.1 hypoth